MTKALRYLLYTLAGIVLLVIVVALILPLVIDPNDFRQPISDEVKSRTGRELAIGRISFSLFPWLGLSLQDLELGNAPGFSAREMVRLKTLNVHVELMPLFHQQLKIDRIVIDGLLLNLEKNRKGIGNWEDLRQGQTPKSAQQAPPRQAPDPGRRKNVTLGKMLAGLTLAGLNLSQARINWDDRSTNQHLSLSDIDLQVGRYTAGKPFDIETRLTYQGSGPIEKARLSLSMSVTADMENRRLALRNIKAEQALTTPWLKSGTLKTGFTAESLVADLDSQTLEATRIDIRANHLQLGSQKLTVTKLLDNPVGVMTLKVHAFSPRAIADELGLSLPVMADEKNTLQRLSLQTRLRAGTSSLKASDLRLRLDDTTLKGRLAVTDFSRPDIRFTLAADALDMDRYLPPEEAGSNARKPATTKAQLKKTSLTKPATSAGKSPTTKTAQTTPHRTDRPAPPLAALAGFDINGLLTVQKLKLTNLRLQDVRMPIRSKQGRFRIEPLSARLYGGDITADVVFDARPSIPTTSITLALNRVRANPLLKDLIDNDKLEGMANVSASLKMRGLSSTQIMHSLTGKMKLAFLDGAIRGINIPQMENRLKARLQGQPLPAADSEERTVFSSITGNLVFTNGKVLNNDLHAAMPHARAIGKGSASLIDRTVDYRLWIKFTSQITGQKGTRYEDMDKAALPVHITGSFERLNIKPDFDNLARQLLQRELKKEEQKARQRINSEVDKKRKELEQKARDALKNLFK